MTLIPGVVGGGRMTKAGKMPAFLFSADNDQPIPDMRAFRSRSMRVM